MLAERLHDPELRLEVGFEEHGVVAGAMRTTRRRVVGLGVAVAPARVEQDGLVREAGGGRDLDRADGDVGEAGHVGEPLVS